MHVVRTSIERLKSVLNDRHGWGLDLTQGYQVLQVLDWIFSLRAFRYDPS